MTTPLRPIHVWPYQGWSVICRICVEPGFSKPGKAITTGDGGTNHYTQAAGIAAGRNHLTEVHSWTPPAR